MSGVMPSSSRQSRGSLKPSLSRRELLKELMQRSMMLQDAPEYPQRRTLVSCQHIGAFAFKGCGSLDMVAFTTDAAHQQLPLGSHARNSGKGVLLLHKEGPVVGLQDCPMLLPHVVPALQLVWAAAVKTAAPVEDARGLHKQVLGPYDMPRLRHHMRQSEDGLSSKFRRRSLNLVRSSLGGAHARNSALLPSSLVGSGANVPRHSFLYRGSLPAGNGGLSSMASSRAADGLRGLAENLQQLLQVRGSAGGSQRGSRASGSQQPTPDVTAHGAPLVSNAAAAAAAAAGSGESSSQVQQQLQDIQLADQAQLQQLVVVGEPAAADAAAAATAARRVAVRANGLDRHLTGPGTAPVAPKQHSKLLLQQQQQQQQQQPLVVGATSRRDAAAAHDVSG
ncbi:hypothetical protein COO60DRAFT_215397 [Scenedesmus sp. NREL 46B-D3]|nr:hypothetical protein COO60DRAFT_215397 [Scenedesmus sp. NREL 46B-D3]